MIVPDPQQAKELAGFIRGVLGCGCPDDVLADLQVDPESTSLAGLPVDFLVNVGGRLLVAICTPHAWRALAQSLDRYFAAGKRLRDENGFNRFRMVVATDDPGNALAVLKHRLDALTGLDDRLHLHVVARSTLPTLLT